MHVRPITSTLALAVALAAFAFPALAKKTPQTVTLSDGLKYTDIAVGTGARPKAGQTVVVTYVGTFADGRKFDASADHGDGTFSFAIGEGQVIKGWDEGVLTMRVGGHRKLIVPPALGYGAEGAGGGAIPPNATLLFDIKLLKIQ